MSDRELSVVREPLLDLGRSRDGVALREAHVAMLRETLPRVFERRREQTASDVRIFRAALILEKVRGWTRVAIREARAIEREDELREAMREKRTPARDIAARFPYRGAAQLVEDTLQIDYSAKELSALRFAIAETGLISLEERIALGGAQPMRLGPRYRELLHELYPPDRFAYPPAGDDLYPLPDGPRVAFIRGPLVSLCAEVGLPGTDALLGAIALERLVGATEARLTSAGEPDDDLRAWMAGKGEHEGVPIRYAAGALREDCCDLFGVRKLREVLAVLGQAGLLARPTDFGAHSNHYWIVVYPALASRFRPGGYKPTTRAAESRPLGVQETDHSEGEKPTALVPESSELPSGRADDSGARKRPAYISNGSLEEIEDWIDNLFTQINLETVFSQEAASWEGAPNAKVPDWVRRTGQSLEDLAEFGGLEREEGAAAYEALIEPVRSGLVFFGEGSDAASVLAAAIAASTCRRRAESPIASARSGSAPAWVDMVAAGSILADLTDKERRPEYERRLGHRGLLVLEAIDATPDAMRARLVADRLSRRRRELLPTVVTLHRRLDGRRHGPLVELLESYSEIAIGTSRREKREAG